MQPLKCTAIWHLTLSLLPHQKFTGETQEAKVGRFRKQANFPNKTHAEHGMEISEHRIGRDYLAGRWLAGWLATPERDVSELKLAPFLWATLISRLCSAFSPPFPIYAPIKPTILLCNMCSAAAIPFKQYGF